MTVSAVLDAAGRRRSPATLPGYHAGRPPRNKGVQYPADPPNVEEVVAVMSHARDNRHGWRLRALIVVLWRGGLRIQEALALSEPHANAVFAVEHLHVNWNEQAVKAAEEYLKTSSFSCLGLTEQLSSEDGSKFTATQAEYAANKVGLC